ncbi:MAG TPA: hypothetical protein VG711_11100 [Phycisphaerales bacterium]|nr:hypothetical protein [Phycisphaerales bacterium]
MREFRLRTDLQRVVTNGFAMPLGIVPADKVTPQQGYTLKYQDDQEDLPPTYTFHVVVSHERVSEILLAVFQLLPDKLFAIVEIGSRDAYRSTDTFLSTVPISKADFLRTWVKYEKFLLEDGSIAAGANSEEPFIEVFVDQWKGIFLHVPLEQRDRFEDLLHQHGLEEVLETWPEIEEDQDPFAEDATLIRSVLDLSAEDLPDVDDVLMNLRVDWGLELNIDPESNVDEAGRELGVTLWHAMVILEPSEETRSLSQSAGVHGGAYASIWASADCLAELEQLLEKALADYPQYQFAEIFTVDRVAHDERPEFLSDLPLRLTESQVLHIDIDPWMETRRGDLPSSGEQHRG